VRKLIQYKEVALSVEKLDLPEENISTILCYLKEGELPWLKLHNPVYSHCKVSRSDIRSFMFTNMDTAWTGRAVASIFHGIQSPNFPVKSWGRVYRFWRAHMDVDFGLLVKMATQEVIKLRTG